VHPVGRLDARRLEDPAPERHDEPGFLGQGDEAVGPDQAQGGVPPADQRLETFEFAVGKADLRLVFEEELRALQGALERVHQRHPVDDA
jgi:hypothetical protein